MRRAKRRSARAARPGMTLVELMVALVVTGIMLLGATALLDAMGAASRQVGTSARRADREANADRVLQTLVAGINFEDTTSRFSGDRETARFTTWCATSAGWSERCAATLAIRPIGGRATLVALPAIGEAMPLVSADSVLELRYLSTAADGGRWFIQWGTSITAPLAIGVIVDADTLIVPIGERG